MGVVLAILALLLRVRAGNRPRRLARGRRGAIKALSRGDWRATAVVAVIHYTVSAILGITLFNRVRLLGTAPPVLE